MSEYIKPPTDWYVIEAEYRANIKPLRQIAAENGITHGAINKRANRDGWERDLGAKIKAKADAKVSKAAVSKEVSKKKLVTEAQVIEANADLQATIRVAHRGDMTRSRKLFQALLGELEAETGSLELFESLGELLDTSGPDQTGTWRKDKLNEIYHKVISCPGRIDGAKKLVEMLEKLVKMERQAYGITDGDEGKGGIEDFLANIRRKADEGAT